jgi:ribose transport system ATP-binding protein
MVENIIEFKNVTKEFPGVTALSEVSFSIIKGETHVLIGENGAGKSTLIKLLCGVHKYEKGSIYYRGKEYAPANPFDSIQKGIRCVYQEFNLLEHMSIAENIYFQHLPRKRGLVDFKKLESDTSAMLEKVGMNDASPNTKVELLGIAQKQLVEIAKAISQDCDVLILDEPTATLTPPETEHLFSIIKSLQEKGVTIIYISHRLQEIREIGDRVSILRNGKYVGTWGIEEKTVDELVTQMVGKEISDIYPYLYDLEKKEINLEVKDLVIPTSPEGVSFSTFKGEILGFSGLVGAGRTELVRAIFGADPIDSGEIIIEGKSIKINNPRDAIKNGICLLTEDRKSQGLILPLSCAINISLPKVKEFAKSGIINRDDENELATKLIDDLSIKVSSYNQLVGTLSGGNQQKVVLAKWLAINPRVIILDEPTRGIDVGAKQEIYLLLWELAKKGTSVICVSSDMPELIGICHRISVFSKGKLVKTLNRNEFSQKEILQYSYQEYLN